ncbi:MAG: DUF4352 domain-containing protein [Erysipelotrichales bacterium]|nr:DUF4352 domain-containing protein [Erysipelotrichales bacterium]
MKKVFCILAVCALIFAGACGKGASKPTAESLMKNGAQWLSERKSLEGNANVSFDLGAETQGLSISVTAGMDMGYQFNVTGKVLHMDGKLKLNMFGTDMGGNVEFYADYTSNPAVSYTRSELMGQDTGWIRTEAETGEASYDITSAYNGISNAKNLTLEKETATFLAKECYVLTGTVDGKDLSSLMGETMGSADLDMIDLNGMNLGMKAYYDKETETPMGFEVGISDTEITMDDGQKMKVNNMKITMTYEGADTCNDLSVPASVIAAAQEAGNVPDNPGGSGTEEGEPNIVEGYDGDEMSTSFFNFTVNRSSLMKSYGSVTAAEGNTLVAVNVTVSNPYTTDVTMYDTDFELLYESASKEAYPVTYTTDKVEEGMLPIEYTLKPGESVTGDLVFEVTAGESVFAFLYVEYYSDGTYGDFYSVYTLAQ